MQQPASASDTSRIKAAGSRSVPPPTAMPNSMAKSTSTISWLFSPTTTPLEPIAGSRATSPMTARSTSTTSWPSSPTTAELPCLEQARAASEAGDPAADSAQVVEAPPRVCQVVTGTPEPRLPTPLMTQPRPQLAHNRRIEARRPSQASAPAQAPTTPHQQPTTSTLPASPSPLSPPTVAAASQQSRCCLRERRHRGPAPVARQAAGGHVSDEGCVDKL